MQNFSGCVSERRCPVFLGNNGCSLDDIVHSAAYCFNHQVMSPDMDPLSEKEILDDLNKVFQAFVGQEKVAQARLQYQSFLMRSGEFSEPALWEGGGSDHEPPDVVADALL